MVSHLRQQDRICKQAPRGYMPFTFRWGAWSLFAHRVLQGLVSGVTYPSLPPIVKRWSLASELSTFISVSNVGGTFGACVTYPIGGIIIQHWGWEVRIYHNKWPWKAVLFPMYANFCQMVHIQKTRTLFYSNLVGQ